MRGKLLVLLPGLGAVATSLIAGVELCRHGLAKAVGSLAEMGRVPSGNGAAHEASRPLRDVVPLASIEDLEFAAWDVLRRDAHASAVVAAVLSPEHLERVEGALARITPMPGAWDRESTPHLEPDHAIDPRRSKREQAERLRDDVRASLSRTGASRAVCVMLTSTEVQRPTGACHASLAAFERALDEDDSSVTPSQLYAYACLRERVPIANGTPNGSLELPALREPRQRPCSLRGRLETLVHADESGAVELDSRDGRVQPVGVRRTADGEAKMRAFEHACARRRPHSQRDVSAPGPRGARRLGLEQDVDAVLAKDLRDLVRDAAVLVREKRGPRWATARIDEDLVRRQPAGSAAREPRPARPCRSTGAASRRRCSLAP